MTDRKKRLAALELGTKRLGFVEVPNYTDAERAALIMAVFQQHGNSTDPETVWRLQWITTILEEARRRRDAALAAKH